MSGTGTFTTTTVATTTNMNFGGGIANAGTVTTPTANFTGTGAVSGAGTYTVTGNVLVTGAVTVTNQVTNLTIGGTLDGTVAGSTWINDINTNFHYQHATAPMATGVLTANNNNSNFYYDLNGAQAVKDGSYFNLIFDAGGVKTSAGNITVGGDWTLASGVTFDPAAGNFDVTGTSVLAGTLADGTVAGTTTLAVTNLSGGTIDGSATGVVNITGAVTLPTADPTIGRATLTFTNTLTIPTGRTVTFNVNSPTGVKTFGTVVVDLGGTWTSTLLNTKPSLVVSTAFTNNGTSSFGGATFGAGAVLTSGGNVTFPNGADGAGNLTLAVTGTVDFQAGSDITTNLVSNAGTSTIFSGGNSTIGGTYNVPVAPATGTISTAGTFAVSGTSQIDGAFVDNNDGAATTFTGLVAVGAAGSFVTSVVATAGNMNFTGGIANTGTFTSDDVNFNGTQTLSGAGTYTIGGDIMVDGAVIVTNQVPSMTVTGVFNGNNAGSTWINDVSTDFHYQNAIAPMLMGILTSNNNLSNFYYDLNGAQAVKEGAYFNLFMSAGNTKTSTIGNITVGNDWTLATGVTFDPAGFDFTVTGVTTLAGILADGNVAGTTSLNGASNISGGTIDGAATGVVNINGAITLPTADPVIGRATLTCTNTLTIPTGRTVTFNANAPAGVKTFGTVVVDAGGTWASTLLTTKASLVVTPSFTNNGTSTFGGATISGTLTSVNALSFPNGLDAATALTANVTGGVGTAAASVFADDLTLVGTTTYTMTGAVNNSVGGNLDVPVNTTLLISNTGTFIVTGTAGVGGVLTDGDNTAATTFAGLVTIPAGGIFTSSAVTTLGNMNFTGGIANTGTFTSDDTNFNGTQTLSGAGTYTIGGDIMVDGAVIVTNQVPSMTVTGVFNGNNAGSTWINDVSTDFHYQNATEPMTVGVLTSNSNLSNFYYDLNGAQAVKAAPYFNLHMNTGGTKTSSGAVTVADTWDLATGVTFNPAGFDFTVTGASTLTGTLADGTVAGTTSLQAVDISGGTIDGAATGVVTISSMTNPTVANTATIGRVALTVAGAVTVSNNTSLVFNGNSPTGLKTFNGLVTVSNGGTWTATNLTVRTNLLLSGGLTNNFNATTFGGATIMGTLTSVVGLDFPNGLESTAPLTINATGTVTVATAAATYDCNFDDLTLGATTNLTFLGGNGDDPLINGNLVVGTGTTLTISNNRDFNINGTSNVSGTIIRTNTGNAAQDMHFGGIVTVNATGVIDMLAVTTNDRVYFAAGLTNDGTCNFGDRIRFGANSILTANVLTDFPDGMHCLVGGSLTIAGAGGVTDHRINNSTVFNGQLIIAADGSYDSRTRVLQSDVQFQAGIEQNNLTDTGFVISRARFSVADQALTGAGNIYILDDVRVDNNRTVTNNNTGNVVVGVSTGRIDAQNAASTWIQGPNSNLLYAGTVRPMDAGILDASGVGNTVIYNTTAVTQDVKQSTYYNLIFTPTNNADAFGAMTVTNQLTLTSGTFDNGANLTMGNNATISRGLGSLTGAPTFGANVNVIYTANLVTSFEMPAAGGTSAAGVLDDLTFSTSGAAVTIGSPISVKGDMTWTSDAIVNMLTNDVRFGTGAIAGSGASAYLKTDGTGNFIKEGAVAGDFVRVYPLGTAFYTPFEITTVGATGGGDLTVRAVAAPLPYKVANKNSIAKYWTVANATGPTGVSATFTFDPSEVVGSVANYEPQIGDGAAHVNATTPSANGTTPTFSITTEPGLFVGDFTYIDATIQVPKTFWSFQSGDWNDPFVWSTTSAGYTNTGTEYPGGVASGDSAIVKNSHIVTGNIAIIVKGVNILSGGIVDVGTQTGHIITNLNGQGTIRLNSLTLPSVTDNSGFVAAGGGTVEYYNIGGAGSNLSTNWMTYNNLTMSNNTATDHLLILQNQTNPSTYVFNGNLSLSATGAGTTTFQLGHTATNIIDLSIGGDINLTSNAFSTVGLFNAIHTVNLTGNITNEGTVDWCNTAQFQQFVNITTGAVRLLAQGASDKLYTCNGPTDVFQLILYLGVDQTYICEINPSVAANWRVFSLRPTGGGHGGSDTPTDYNFDHAYHIDKGTLKFSGASYVQALGRQNAQFLLEEGDRLWLASGTLDLVTPGISDGTIRMTRTGETYVTGGTLNLGDDGFNFQDKGVIRIAGGTVNTNRFLNMYPGDGDASFIMSAGTLNIRAVDAEGSNYLSRFSYTNPICGIDISGGTINVYDPISTTNMDGGTLSIMSSAASVTGGTWNFYLPASNVDMKIAMAIPMWDVNVYKQGAGTSRLLLSAVGASTKYTQKQGVTILNDLTIDGTNSPIFDANGETVTVGGNFNIVSGGTYQGATQTIFTGTNASTFTIGSTQANTTDLSIQKTGAGSVTMAGAATFDCIENLDVTGGVFDIGATVPLDVAGNVTNAGTIQGAEQLRMQRGVVTANVTGGAYVMPTITNGGGAGATFAITIEDGRIIDVTGSGGAGYGTNNRQSMTVGGAGAGAVIRCRTTNNVDSCWVQTEGTGYGPSVTIAGGGGTGATAAAILTGDQGAAATLTIDVVNPGEGYTSPATYTITGGGTADDVTVAPNISGGTFANVSLNNYQGATATSDLTLTDDLRLANGNLAMDAFALNLGTGSDIYDGLAGVTTVFDNTKMVTTGGLASNGGIVKAFNGLCFLYPQGIGTDYMEENLCFSGAPGAYGTITVKPVSGEHPLVSATGQSLTAYWNISSAGTTVAPATVSHTMKYADAQVVDNGGTVLETEYVAGRYTAGATAWTADAAPFVTAGTNTGTVSGATFNATIDGDYTFGDQTPNDPFALVTTYYSRTGGTYNYNTVGDFSIDATLKHGGAAAAAIPGVGDVVIIGDGAGINHTMTVTANTQLSAFITISPGSTLDIGTTTGHNFGSYTSYGASDGTLKISSAVATAEFPAGDWSSFNDATGGTVEYYNTGAQDFTIPAINAAPTSAALAQYRLLILTPSTGQIITFPDIDVAVLEDITVQGASATGLVYLNTATARALTVGRDINVTSGNLQMRDGTSQALTVAQNVAVTAGAIFDVENAGATAHTIEITGSLVNDGTVTFMTAGSDLDVTFVGTVNTAISGTTGGAATTLNKLTVNKGTDQTAVLDVTVLGTFTPPTNDWLTLTNGTFRFSLPQTITLYDADGANATPVTNALYIPSTTCLSVNNAAGIVRATSTVHGNTTGWNDVYLGGKLEIIDGAFYVGTGALNNNRSNDIEYATTGTPEIDIQAGILYVQGQIRRDASIAAGDLTWNQTGGTVTIGGRNSSNQYGRFEVLNNGVFNMSAGTIIINRTGTTHASYADFYLNPASSAITGGTIQFGVTGDNTHNNQLMSIRSSVALNNIVVDGNTADTVAVRINIAPLTINGTLTVSNDFSAFNCNGADLIFAANGVLVNNNTSALHGVTSAGFYPGVSTQNTTFQSTTAAQTITGTGANVSNFGNLIINNTFGNVTLATGDIAVNGDLTITTTLADGGQTINSKENIINNGNHSGAGAIVMNGSAAQDVSGTGIFENIQLNNAVGATTSTNMNVNGVFTIDAGVFDISDKLLEMQTAASFATNTAFSSTVMLKTNGTLADLGVKKYLAIGATDITYPIGVTGKYTPVRHNITANTATGDVTIKSINTKHNSTQDPADKELTYYWNIVSTGLAGLSVDHYYTYDQTDVQGTESDYRIGVFKGSQWDPAHGFAGVNDGTNLATLAAQNYLTADWTMGESNGGASVEFATLDTYYSITDGDWDTPATWSTISHVGAAAVGTPAGNPTLIGTGHTVTITANVKVVPSLQINGTGVLDAAATFGHNFGTVSGTGTLRGSGTVGGTYFLHLGDFTAFVADGAGTWEYYGTNDGTLPAQFEYNNLVFTGASTKTFALGDVTVNSDFTINSGIVNNVTNNVALNIEGDWTNSEGFSGYSPGTGTVNMTSTVNRSIVGSTEFYDLDVNNTGGTVTVTGAKMINNSLTLTSGVLDFGSDSLMLGVTTTITSPGFSAARMIQLGGAYTDGGVFMNCNTNPRNITLPIGSGGLYTPVNYNITANTLAGNISMRPVAAVQPYTNDVNNKELTYYWNVRSTGFSGLALTQTYTYDDSDVQGTEGNYKGGHFQDSLDWSPVNGHVGSVNSATNVISIPSGSIVAGDYTAGESDGAVSFEFGPADTYYSIADGNYGTLAAWSTDPILQHTGIATTVLPRTHNAMVVGNGNVVTVAGDEKIARSMDILVGSQLILGTTVDHNFRDINGTGTMRVNVIAGAPNSFTLPQGFFDDFVSAGGGTVHYVNNIGTADLPDSLVYCGLKLTGGNKFTIPALAGLTLNGDFILDEVGTNFDNSATNIPLSIKGNWSNTQNFTGYLAGTETVTFDGVAIQVVDGNHNFSSIAINNAAGVTLDDSVRIAATLAFADGVLGLTNNMLLMLAGPGNITGYGPSAYVATTDRARLKIANVAAVATPFPIGTIGANKYAPVILTNTGTVADMWVGAIDFVYPTGTPTAGAPAVNPTSGAGGDPSAFTQDAVSKTWLIMADTAAGLTAEEIAVTVAWHTDSELPGFDRNFCAVNRQFKRNVWGINGKGDWRILEAGPSSSFPIVPLVAGYFTQTSSAKRLFGSFGVGSGSLPLPIELLTFDAVRKEKVVDVSWSTGAEINNELFQVERSADGINFNVQESRAGAGNSANLIQYNFVDKNPLTGVSYYRLKQIDFDKRFTYSAVRSVVFESDEVLFEGGCSVSLFPNPASPSTPFSLEFKDVAEKKQILIVVVDMAGREFYSKVVKIEREEDKIIVIDLGKRLEPGIYLITGSADNSLFNKKLIVK